MADKGNRVRRGLLEVFVVALGVFGGLAADEWRVRRAEKAEASDYVRRLVEVLGTDSAFLQMQATDLSEKKPALERLASLQRLDDSSAAAQQVAADLVMGASWSWGGIPIQRHTMTELVSSGNLDLLRPDLREALGSYYTAAEVWDASLRARRSAAGLSTIATRFVRVRRSTQGAVAEALTPLEQETLLRSLDLLEVRQAATAELNATEVAATFLESLLGSVEELLSLLKDEAADT